MGLDMFAYRVKKENAVNDFEFNGKIDENGNEEFFYWRKHHDLHGLMEQIYREKGGVEEFNCIPVRLTLDDLDRIEQTIKEYKLPETTGFFFGNNPPDDESNEVDFRFIDEARKIIHEGDFVYYSSWW